MTPFRPAVLMMSAATVLACAACSRSEPEAAQPSPEAPSLAIPVSAPAPAPRAAAIQTQDGPEGMRVSLTRAQVTGSVLTVQLSYDRAADGFASDRYSAEEVAVIDDTTSQRYGVLKDGTGRWQASPLQDATSSFLTPTAGPGEPAVVWFKFPAPPATSPTVSITVPNVGPFDGVTVQR